MSESQRWYLFDNMMNSERSLEKNKNQSPIHGMPDRLCFYCKNIYMVILSGGTIHWIFSSIYVDFNKYCKLASENTQHIALGFLSYFFLGLWFLLMNCGWSILSQKSIVEVNNRVYCHWAWRDVTERYGYDHNFRSRGKTDRVSNLQVGFRECFHFKRCLLD